MERIRPVAEVIGGVAIVASLLFVGIQLKQDQQFAQTEALAAEQMADLELARFLDDNIVTWRKGLAGEKLSEDEQATFDLLAYALFRQQSYQLRQQITLSGEISENEGRSYAYFIYQNPGLRKWFNQLIEIRSTRYRAYGLPDENRFYPLLINDHLRKLDESSPELPEHYIRPY